MTLVLAVGCAEPEPLGLDGLDLDEDGVLTDADLERGVAAVLWESDLPALGGGELRSATATAIELYRDPGRLVTATDFSAAGFRLEMLFDVTALEAGRRYDHEAAAFINLQEEEPEWFGDLATGVSGELELTMYNGARASAWLDGSADFELLDASGAPLGSSVEVLGFAFAEFEGDF